MAASVTHLVIGEQVYLSQTIFPVAPDLFGAFLAGCILVDLHAFQPVDRRLTHLIGRVEEDGEAAFTHSCANFLAQLDTLLKAPWNQSSQIDQAFTAGYLCHLAVDECWKKLGWNLMQSLGITSWADFPVPGDVSLTVFDFLMARRTPDYLGTTQRLDQIRIPDVFTHVPLDLFVRQWDMIRSYVLSGALPDEHGRMLRLAGKPEKEFQASDQRHRAAFESAIAWYTKIGVIEPFVNESIQHTLGVLKNLIKVANRGDYPPQGSRVGEVD